MVTHEEIALLAEHLAHLYAFINVQLNLFKDAGALVHLWIHDRQLFSVLNVDFVYLI